MLFVAAEAMEGEEEAVAAVVVVVEAVVRGERGAAAATEGAVEVAIGAVMGEIVVLTEAVSAIFLLQLLHLRSLLLFFSIVSS